MKKHFTLLFLFISAITFAQQGINYKAVLKDASDTVLANTFMNVQFSIHESTATGTIVYQEDHNYTTDANGLLILVVGSDTNPSVGPFTSINWSANRHFLQTTITYSGGTLDFDATEFMSVPYAQHATTANTVNNPPFFEPYILGVSIISSNGRFQYNGKNGWQAANEMCKISYPDEPYARAFTNEQITQAILLESYSANQNYNNRVFWSITSSKIRGTGFTNTSAGNNNLNLGSNSGEFTRGIQGQILFDYTTPGNGGGLILPRYFDANSEIGPNLTYPCLCGTYKIAAPNN